MTSPVSAPLRTYFNCEYDSPIPVITLWRTDLIGDYVVPFKGPLPVSKRLKPVYTVGELHDFSSCRFAVCFHISKMNYTFKGEMKLTSAIVQTCIYFILQNYRAYLTPNHKRHFVNMKKKVNTNDIYPQSTSYKPVHINLWSPRENDSFIFELDRPLLTNLCQLSISVMNRSGLSIKLCAFTI